MSFKFFSSQLRENPTVEVPELGVSVKVLMGPADSDRAVSIIETTNAPKFGPPLHRHPETEVFRVLEGRYLFEVDGELYDAAPGDVLSVPGGVPHRFLNVTDQPARQLVMVVPALDVFAFFTDLANTLSQDIPRQEALNAFGGRWNCEFLGGPLHLDG